MKKFLCYDTNDAASGKIGVNSNGVLSPNATVPSTNGAANQYLVTDSNGNTKWEDKLAYDTTKSEFVGTQYSINLDPTSGTVISQDIIPMELGQTYTVKVTRGDGQGTKEYTGLDVAADDDGTLYIGSSDFESGFYPFRITESLTTVVSAFVMGGGYTLITATCTSNGKIKTIDPKYIKDMYCDNRTMLVEQTTVKNADVDGPIINFSLLVNGTPVTVNVDGTEYNVTLEEGGRYTLGTGSVSCDYHIGSYGAIDIRDHITYTGDYPFFVVINVGDESGRCMVLFDSESTGTEHEFAVYSGSIKQIDPKYIPSPNVIVNITRNEDGTGSADKTYAEVKALIDSGADVKCRVETSVADYVGLNVRGNIMCFEATTFDGPYLKLFIFFAPDEIFTEVFPLSEMLLPGVSASDNNKFLSVVNGAWQASSNLIVPSSTSGSSKKFKITVDDSGAITATEV